MVILRISHWLFCFASHKFFVFYLFVSCCFFLYFFLISFIHFYLFIFLHLNGLVKQYFVTNFGARTFENLLWTHQCCLSILYLKCKWLWIFMCSFNMLIWCNNVTFQFGCTFCAENLVNMLLFFQVWCSIRIV